ncbi:hypothetical protein A6302_00588 [Methylobrevis pamukkalensis]|uniref:VWFA domain-containing protein n=2 Tax=Methylobrevis pamukkalensis TaxID=1439726 RepID=A0A1E3H6X1_9HYPH|nr:hypothetical protein A6302_00588 [Methylobrevis pamukkalensis]
MARRLTPNAPAQFAQDTRGSVAMLFSFSLLAILLAVGAAVDYGHATKIRGQMLGALDSAALIAAKQISMGETDTARINALARAQYDANFRVSKDSEVETTSFVVVPDFDESTVSVTSEIEVPTFFMALAGLNDLPVSSTATAAIDGTRVEVAMMIDLTGSMGDWASGSSQPKVKDLEKASKSLVETLLPAGTDVNGKVRIAIAPFSEGVNPGSYLTAVSGVAKPDTKCVVERTGTAAASDAAPADAPVPLAPVKKMDGSFYCLSRTIQPLTDDRTTLISALTSLPTGGYTAGHIGSAWAQYLLSPKWASLFPADNRPSAYGSDVQKIAILMTDGLYNTYYDISTTKNYKTAVHNQASASASAATAICSAMKANGVVVYTIGFDLTGASGESAKKTLKACASTVDGELAFFDAANGAELLAAYGEIANQILNLRLSS